MALRAERLRRAIAGNAVRVCRIAGTQERRRVNARLVPERVGGDKTEDDHEGA